MVDLLNLSGTLRLVLSKGEVLMTAVLQEERIWIPAISDERLAILAARIRPLVQFPGERGLHYIEPIDPRKESFIWNPVKAEPATGLQELEDIVTYHTYNYATHFEPTIAQVLAAIPSRLLADTAAFKVHISFDDDAHLYGEKEALRAGYHVAQMKLYRKK